MLKKRYQETHLVFHKGTFIYEYKKE